VLEHLVWNPLPPINIVFEELQNIKGGTTDKELFIRLFRQYGIGKAEFYKALMTLEMKGLITVSMSGDELLIRLKEG